MHFITLTFWESYEAIKSFAGEELNAAKYYPEDKDFLLEFEPTVLHYEVVGQSEMPGPGVRQYSICRVKSISFLNKSNIS